MTEEQIKSEMKRIETLSGELHIRAQNRDAALRLLDAEREEDARKLVTLRYELDVVIIETKRLAVSE